MLNIAQKVELGVMRFMIFSLKHVAATPEPTLGSQARRNNPRSEFSKLVIIETKMRRI